MPNSRYTASCASCGPYLPKVLRGSQFFPISLLHRNLAKAHSHRGIPGNDRADLNASKGVSSHTPIGRFSTFPPFAFPNLTQPETPTSALDSLKIVQTTTASTDECFPPKPPIACKPYISSERIALINQLPHASATEPTSPQHD